MALGGGIGTVIILVLYLLFGGDPTQLANLQDTEYANIPAETTPAMEAQKKFVAVVLGDTEEIWGRLFQEQGAVYQQPRLVLFAGQVQSACGFASAAVGPFYCTGDDRVYLDLEFFDELSRRFGAPGDFAQAYVIAHEVGHHVQNLTGISDEVQQQRSRLDEREYNRLSVRLELQADYLAGVWAHHAQQRFDILESGDIEEALTAANAIGDDRIQKQTRGTIVPDSFTHGTSAQRIRWFRYGLESGDFVGANRLFELEYEEL
jgi:predicted metalloprotease